MVVVHTEDMLVVPVAAAGAAAIYMMPPMETLFLCRAKVVAALLIANIPTEQVSQAKMAIKV